MLKHFLTFRSHGVFTASLATSRGLLVFTKWLTEIKSIRDPKALESDAVNYGHYIDLKLAMHNNPETQITDEEIIYRFAYDFLQGLKDPLLPAYNDASMCYQILIIR